MEDLKFHVFSLKEEEEVLVESFSIHLRFRSFLNEGERVSWNALVLSGLEIWK